MIVAEHRDLSGVFLDAAPDAGRERWGDDPALASRLERILARVRQRWPEISVPEEEFVTYLAQRAPVDSDASLAAVNVEDLYLACACARGDPLGVVELETNYIAPADVALLRLDVPAVVREEAKQALRARLLVGEGAQGAKIAAFAGRGDLASWVRVSAVRLALDLHRKRGKERLVGDEALSALPGALDPQSEYLREHYRAHLGEVFRDALASLAAKDRNVLRYHYLKGLNLDQIGAIYNIHKSSASRRLARARERLLRETRVRLIARLDVSRSTADSLLRLLPSQLAESVRHAFGSTHRG